MELDTADWDRASLLQDAVCICLSLLLDGAASLSLLHLPGSPKNDPRLTPAAEISYKSIQPLEIQ